MHSHDCDCNIAVLATELVVLWVIFSYKVALETDFCKLRYSTINTKTSLTETQSELLLEHHHLGLAYTRSMNIFIVFICLESYNWIDTHLHCSQVISVGCNATKQHLHLYFPFNVLIRVCQLCFSSKHCVVKFRDFKIKYNMEYSHSQL